MPKKAPMNPQKLAADGVAVTAYAKINLCLRIVRRRPDGMHDLDGIMHALTLADSVHVAPDQKLQLETIDVRRTAPAGPGPAPSGPPLPAVEENIAWRAAHMLQRAAGVTDGGRITLYKRIPVAAGLGGGSADAAAVLVALNCLWGLNWPQQRLAQLGLQLGADVPFALLGGAARARGVGEQLQPLPALTGMPVVLIPQNFPVATGDIFRAWQPKASGSAVGRRETVRPGPAAAMAQSLARGSLAQAARHCGNDLQPVAAKRHPKIQQALADLHACQPVAAQMTGSGPTVFGLFAQRQQARRAVRRLRMKWPQTRLSWLTAAGPRC